MRAAVTIGVARLVFLPAEGPGGLLLLLPEDRSTSTFHAAMYLLPSFLENPARTSFSAPNASFLWFTNPPGYQRVRQSLSRFKDHQYADPVCALYLYCLPDCLVGSTASKAARARLQADRFRDQGAAMKSRILPESGQT
jgi:hypothetical protein